MRAQPADDEAAQHCCSDQREYQRGVDDGEDQVDLDRLCVEEDEQDEDDGAVDVVFDDVFFQPGRKPSPDAQPRG
jgi:hypothetical protein